MRLVSLVFSLIWIAAPLLRVQSQHLQFDHISTGQGLSHSTINCILQDRTGFMWFGTKDGLNKFDGYAFTLFEHNPAVPASISSNVIRCILEDREGFLWIGTAMGLNKFDSRTETFTHYVHNPSDYNSLSDNNILSLYEDREGILWIGTTRGLNRFDRRADTFSLFSHNPNHTDNWTNNLIHTIYEDRQQNLWLGTSLGLSLFDRNTQTFTRYPHTNPAAGNPDVKKPVKAILEDHLGTLWVATLGDGLKQFNRDTRTFTTYLHMPEDEHSISSNFILSLLEDSFGTIWVGTQDRGLDRFSRQSGKFSHYPHRKHDVGTVCSNSVTAIYEDFTKVLWIGTFTDGINKTDLLKKPILHIKPHSEDVHNLQLSAVYSLFEDYQENIWVGSPVGLSRLDKKSGKNFLYRYNDGFSKSPGDYTAHYLYSDKSEDLWIALSGAGLKRFNRKTNQFTSYRHSENDIRTIPHNLVNTIYEDPQGNMWIGTRSGIARWNPDTGDFTRYLPDYLSTLRFDVVSLLQSRTGEFWVATSEEGLHSFNPKTGKFSPFAGDIDAYLKSAISAITNLYEDHEGKVWICSGRGGLYYMCPEAETITAVTHPTEIAKAVINGIMEDNGGNLWLGTRKNGIIKYNPVTNTARTYGMDDGLQGNEFNRAFFQNHQGEMYAGGRNGFNVFHPDSVRDNPHAPRVVISQFKVFDQPRHFSTDGITLPYQDNFFSFDFVALSYALPDKNQYAYMLEGFDQDWIKSGTRRYASYTNLNPGEYVFRVKAANHDGVWNEAGTAITVRITPPFWQTGWAYLGYALLLAGAIYGFWHYTVSQERLRHRLQLKSLESENLQELDKVKSQFFANVSHELRTPLTLLISPLEQLISGKVAEGRQGEYFQMMHRNARRLLELINQLLDISRIEAGRIKPELTAGDIIESIRTGVASFVSLAESKQVTLSFTAQPGELLTYFDPDKLEKILYNLLSNACKFTPAGGNISVQVSVQQTTGENIFVSDNAGPVIVIRVQDTGIGIGAESLNKIFDRFYQVDSSQTRAFEGLGIGLALTKELIELQRGTISVRSEEGKGTCFTVTLPLLAIQPEDLTVPGSGTATEMPGKAPILVPLHPAVQPDNLSLRKVNPPVNPDDPTPLMLIVEDNADLRQYIVNTFSENYRVLEARDGLEGLNTAIEHIPDIIISDLMMPQLDGLSLCAKLKTDERTSHIPVILLTARTSMQSKMAGLENGADDYLTKPFYAEEVEVRVRNLIQQRRKLRERFSLSAVVEPAEAVLNSADERFLTSLNTVIEDNIADPAMDIEFLEKEIGLSRVQLYRKLKALTDQAPIEYIRNIRLQRAGVLLAQQYGNISEVAYKVGFNNLSYFTKCFRQHYGMTPSEYILSHSDVHSSE